MPNATDIREPMYASIRSNIVTAFDSVVAGSTGAKKVWRGLVPETDSAGAEITPPWVLILGFSQRRGQFSNFDADGPDGTFGVTVAVSDTTAAAADVAGAIAAAIQAQLTPSNVTASGFAIKSLRLDADNERGEAAGQSNYFYVDQVFAFSAYPS